MFSINWIDFSVSYFSSFCLFLRSLSFFLLFHLCDLSKWFSCVGTNWSVNQFLSRPVCDLWSLLSFTLVSFLSWFLIFFRLLFFSWTPEGFVPVSTIDFRRTNLSVRRLSKLRQWPRKHLLALDCLFGEFDSFLNFGCFWISVGRSVFWFDPCQPFTSLSYLLFFGSLILFSVYFLSTQPIPRPPYWSCFLA